MTYAVLLGARCRRSRPRCTGLRRNQQMLLQCPRPAPPRGLLPQKLPLPGRCQHGVVALAAQLLNPVCVQ
eukprot:44011-Pyramimonas_sp.AAC.1